MGILELALITLVRHERAAHLEHATTSNRRMGVTLGVLVAHDRTTTDQAFETLAAASQALNIRLVDLAEEVILTGAIPDHHQPGLALLAPRNATPRVLTQPEQLTYGNINCHELWLLARRTEASTVVLTGGVLDEEESLRVRASATHGCPR